MAKMGCAQCGKSMSKGGVKKMAKGGMPDKVLGAPKKPFAAGIPYYTGAGQTGPESMKKGGSLDNRYNRAVGPGCKGGYVKDANGNCVPVRKAKKGAVMKDLSGDGKITRKDVLIGRGVIPKKAAGGPVGSKAGKGPQPPSPSRTYTTPAAPKQEGRTQQMWKITVDSNGNRTKELIPGKPENKPQMISPNPYKPSIKKSKMGGPILKKKEDGEPATSKKLTRLGTKVEKKTAAGKTVGKGLQKRYDKAVDKVIVKGLTKAKRGGTKK